MPTITTGDKILVSGANGYIAMWAVRLFLERGYFVRGTVRSEDKAGFMKEYFSSIGFDDKFETFIVEDIVKVRFKTVSYNDETDFYTWLGRSLRWGC